MSAHTPGPWEIHGATKILKWGEKNGAVCIVAEPGVKSTSDFREVEPHSERWVEAMANASLISAAQDLLIELRKAKCPVCDQYHIAPPANPPCSFCAGARAAIVKAEGR